MENNKIVIFASIFSLLAGFVVFIGIPLYQTFATETGSCLDDPEVHELSYQEHGHPGEPPVTWFPCSWRFRIYHYGEGDGDDDAPCNCNHDSEGISVHFYASTTQSIPNYIADMTIRNPESTDCSTSDEELWQVFLHIPSIWNEEEERNDEWYYRYFCDNGEAYPSGG